MEKYFKCLFYVSEHSKHFCFHFYFSPFLFLSQFPGGAEGVVTVNYELKYCGPSKTSRHGIILVKSWIFLGTIPGICISMVGSENLILVSVLFTIQVWDRSRYWFRSMSRTETSLGISPRWTWDWSQSCWISRTEIGLGISPIQN